MLNYIKVVNEREIFNIWEGTFLRLICLMGRSGKSKMDVRDNIEKLGYNRVVTYKTGKLEDGEINGKDYHLVSEEDFFKLVDKDIIADWVEYEGEYYGYPHPIGSRNNVILIEPNGYKRMREIYGKQAIGVYLDSGIDIYAKKIQRKKSRIEGTNILCFKSIKNEDNIKFRGIESDVDLVVHGEDDIDSITSYILHYISSNNL